MRHAPRNHANIPFAREQRKSMSRAEKKLWYDGLNHQRLGYRFRRQHTIGPYTLDFYCPELKLCIEVDGDQHEQRQERDARRDAYLASFGIKTLRFAADAVLIDLGTVLYKIKTVCEGLGNAPPPCPPPSPDGGGSPPEDSP